MSSAPTTHHYLTAAGAALGDERHTVSVTDDQGNNSKWSCAACPANNSHAYHKHAHTQAQAHAAQCTALPTTDTPHRAALGITLPAALLFLFLFAALSAALADWLA